jgi:dipeptidyl aminopeptidase/acylaminoacyl peptidase
MRRLVLSGAILFVGVTLVATASGSTAKMDPSRPLQGRIAFHRHVDGDINGHPEIFVVDADGSDERNVTQGRGGFDPTWSPDGRRLAFARDGRVWVVNGDRSGERALTPDPLGASFPVWSPDGRRIAFQTWPGHGDKGRLAVVNTNRPGLRMVAVAYPPSLWPNGRPAWSPDGRWIAFRRQNILVVRADGRNERTVGRCKSRCAVDGWSPDGRWMTFGDSLVAATIWILRPEVGSRSQRLLAHGGGASWSPNGRTIAFERDGTIQIMNADGTNARQLTKGFHPVWSPDGRALAFMRGNAGSDGVSIYTIRINGTGQHLLTDNAWLGFPAWGP